MQVATVGSQQKFWLQSEWVSKARGGFVWSDKEDASVWMNLGQKKVGSGCGRIVQISWGMSREQILRALEVFGEVVGIYLEMRSVSYRFEYTGVGYVQYRHPSSLHTAWNYEHSKRQWGIDPVEIGVEVGQR
eukprot:4635458-Karenia_brevis.AAC.1